MNKNSLVSVVLPVFNGERFVAHAIESVLAQSYSNFELIVVNDGSTDDSLKVISQYQNQATIVSYDKNKGGNHARNKGYEASNGEYIAYLDNDDLWHKDKLKIYMDILPRHQDISYVLSDFNRFLWDTREYYALTNSQLYPKIYELIKLSRYKDIKAFVIPKNKAFPLFLEGYPAFSSTIMVRRSLLEKINGWDESLKRNQDYDLTLRSIRHTDILYIDERLTDIGRHDSNLSTDISKQLDGDIDLMRKHLGYDGYTIAEKSIIGKYIGKRLCGKGYNFLNNRMPRQAVRKYYDALHYPDVFWHASIRLIYALIMCVKYPKS